MPSINPRHCGFDHTTWREAGGRFYTSIFPENFAHRGLETEAPMPAPANPGFGPVRHLRAGRKPVFVGIQRRVRISRSARQVSFTIDCKDQDEVDYYWGRLNRWRRGSRSAAGCKDRFGLSLAG